MTTKMESYKKKLMEYRKSIGATSSKITAFRESSPDLEEDFAELHFHTCPLQRQEHKGYQFATPEKDVENRNRSAARELDYLKVTSPPAAYSPRSARLQSPGLTKESSSNLFGSIGRYANWNSHHALLASQPWCCFGDLMAFCDKYEFKAISVSDVQMHANIVSDVRGLLSGKAPFDMRRRFPGSIRNPENLLVCIGRCPSVEYHLERITTAFRRPLNKLSTEKQNIAKQNFHLAIRELRLDLSARITEIRLYDRQLFEKEFHLNWQDSI